MYPKIGTIPVYSLWYFGGIVAHFLICLLLARRLRVRPWTWVAFTIAYAFAMCVGAKALYDLKAGKFALSALVSAEHYMAGGLWGGPLVFLALAVPVALWRTETRAAALDLVALSLPIPMLLAKVGCLFEGCCHGKPCSWPWAITFPEGGTTPSDVSLHPTQIYELLLLAAIWVILRRVPRRGTALPWFLLVYGVGRAVIETFRGDVTKVSPIGWLTHSQLLCLLAAAGAGIGLMVLRKRKTELQASSNSAPP